MSKIFCRAKRISFCAQTNKTIKIGEPILWNTSTGKVYCNYSKEYKKELNISNFIAT